MKFKRILMIISLVLVLVVNLLANTLPINGLTTGEVSDRFPILFVPAGYVFSIWGLIYIALIAFAIYSITPNGMANEDIYGISGWIIAANLFNTAWIFLWHYQQFLLTLIPMFGLLASLLAIYLNLRIGKKQRSLKEKLLVEAPFGIYLGWITVAVVANVSQVLFNIGWQGDPLSASFWTVVMLLVATTLGVLMIFLRKEIAYPLVLSWAFVGIYLKHSSVASVGITALAAAILLVVLAIGRLVFNRKVTA